MRILVTNDDGIASPGIAALAQALLDDGHDVVVAGPMSERSGSGTAIGPIEHDVAIPAARHQLPTRPSVEAIGLDAPPALAVLAALSGTFGPRPDLVVSGINPGHNTGRSVVFSGTVGAILAASIAGVPGIAVSCGFAPEHRYDTAAVVAALAVSWIERAGLPKLSLNINVPDLDLDRIDGSEFTRLAQRSLFGIRMELHEDLHLERFPTTAPQIEGTDSAAIAAGRISLSLLRPPEERVDFDHTGLLEAMNGLDGLGGTAHHDTRS